MHNFFNKGKKRGKRPPPYVAKKGGKESAPGEKISCSLKKAEGGSQPNGSRGAKNRAGRGGGDALHFGGRTLRAIPIAHS